LDVLRRSRHAMFADRHRRVHGLLERFHRSRSGETSAADDRTTALFARRWEYVWEHELRGALHALPVAPRRGAYQRPGEAPIGGLVLRPDVVAAVGDRIWVVDAKHYVPNTLPRTESLTKQALYRWLLSVEGGGRWPLERIRSVFLLPGVGVAGGLSHVATHRVPGAPLVDVDVLKLDLMRLSEARELLARWEQSAVMDAEG
ncbi:MAG: hypothetical protein ACI9K2_002804, partial [Myxococcota bacterium]